MQIQYLPVKQTGLAHVGPPHQSHIRRVFAQHRGDLRQVLRGDLVQQLPNAIAVDATDGVRLAQAEFPELLGLRHALGLRLALVDRHEDGHLAMLSEPVGDDAVQLRQALLPVTDEDRRLCLAKSDQRLLSDTLREDVLCVVEDDPAGVHHLEVVVAPGGGAVCPVARDARFVVYDGSVLK